MIKISNFINGKLCEPMLGQYIDNYDPARGIVYSLIPDSDERDVAAATQAAKEAFSYWSGMRLEVEPNHY